ncbi:MAG: GNAT family N-acetyltransferase [Candidatus Limnocylindrales bacterium]
MLHRSWFPDRLVGDRVILKRHVSGNLAAFMRWYADPEVSRLTRYQDGPMARPEIERFFQARVLGSDSLAMAIHEQATDRLLGTCAFSQLDGENGSALFHITIGEKEAWGQGFGTEATRLMLEHAFERLRLHRIGLSVFAFNERAIRSYRRAGFVIDGRAREAIRRDGRWWDEVEMSILDSDWRAMSAVPVGPGAASGSTAGLGTEEAPLTDPATGRPVDAPTIQRIG